MQCSPRLCQTDNQLLDKITTRGEISYVISVLSNQGSDHLHHSSNGEKTQISLLCCPSMFRDSLLIEKVGLIFKKHRSIKLESPKPGILTGEK